MKITMIEVMRIAIPFDAHRRPPAEQETTFNAASPSLSRMETLLVKVTSDNGLVGWGEGFGHLANPVTEQALSSLVAPFFLQRELPDSQQAIAALMQSAEQALHAFGRSGPVRYALSAIDIALWDLLGQQRQQPLWQLLGATRQRIERYASLVSYANDPQEVAAQVQRAHQQGFRTMKLHETAQPAIAAARAALPADVQLMVDVNCPWTREQASQQAYQLRSLNLGWLEEPIWPPDDFDGLAQLRRVGVPLAAGENVDGDFGFVNLLESGAVDVVQPSVTKVGGITAALHVFELAQQYRVRVVPHCFYYGAGMLATAHLVAALPESVKMEIPWIDFAVPLYPDLPAEVSFNLSQRPGLGYQPDEQVLREYRLTHQQIDQQGVQRHV
ncbi:mandelate racemase/muconate lactonizing enzyme family protein [Erwiniaceae bacterium L1_54_6]|jgi:L-rhamnonate dehydratase|uniref:Mandelate racemase/muconate lactonizing enzyme family protein n=1 Tax=Pantoea cypripedii TaxID=55209 RepID=A0A6B9G7E8_PANCY|nr:mandelate racemase/muconate lactonizing enzyme family protein [Pantoea cypripedii]MDF7661374.1 mandelate racemase/muconate lactonizing enzyme family protein [Erwiniaceae bacterium L1_54_6]QGY27946.1 mandelate racemase/muconate lactonizing enzyme family protein [Pantoea cypripedii]